MQFIIRPETYITVRKHWRGEFCFMWDFVRSFTHWLVGLATALHLGSSTVAGSTEFDGWLNVKHSPFLLAFKAPSAQRAALRCGGMLSIISASFQVFSMQREAFWHPTWSKAGYSTTTEELLHAQQDSVSLCTTCVYVICAHWHTLTHTFIMLLWLSGRGSSREINLLMHLWCRLNENLAHHGFSPLGRSFFY